ncbi:melanopsin-like isoform X1 [Neodiprion fabricii]|uniref:melanopsin-like isoform X1 n=1 Tax=Neodiprion fabricii TaxID=2872261 RepID=UPI001ED94492|nr:melanopsin-like isoform X1 [Neodiprion fabricii]
MSLDALNASNGIEEQEVEDVGETTYLVTAGVLIAIGVLGAVLNMTVIIVILRDRQTLLTPVNVVLLNLVVSVKIHAVCVAFTSIIIIGDFCVSIIGTPFPTVSAILGRWYWGYTGCLWYAWFMSTLGLASIGNLTVLAIERWLLVTRPMRAFTIRQASYLVSGVWIYTLSLTIPPLCGWGSYGPEAGNLSCSVSWEVHDPSIGSDTYIAFLFFFGLVVPVILICWSYFEIIRTLRKVRKRAGSRGTYEAKVTKMVALMIIAFLIAWTPYSISALLAQYLQVTSSPTVAIVPALLAKSSICYNPLIYAGMNSQFRTVMKKFLGMSESTRPATISQHTGVSASNRAGINPIQIEKE